MHKQDLHRLWQREISRVSVYVPSFAHVYVCFPVWEKLCLKIQQRETKADRNKGTDIGLRPEIYLLLTVCLHVCDFCFMHLTSFWSRVRPQNARAGCNRNTAAV